MEPELCPEKGNAIMDLDTGGGDVTPTQEPPQQEFLTMHRGKGRTPQQMEIIHQQRQDRLNSAQAHNPGESLTRSMRKNIKKRIARRNQPYSKPELVGSSTSVIPDEPEPVQSGLANPSPVTPLDHVNTVFVTRNDELLLDFEDLTYIRAEIATAEIQLVKLTGSNPHDIKATFQKGLTFDIVCNTMQAVIFYKNHINKTSQAPLEIEEKSHKGFTAYDVIDKPKRYLITGEVHRSHTKHQEDLHYAFAGSSCGHVGVHQVKQYKAPMINPSGNLRIYLELDEAAFLWLKSEQWWSRIGGSRVRWCAPNLYGLMGRYAPDADLREIKRHQDLVSSGSQETLVQSNNSPTKSVTTSTTSENVNRLLRDVNIHSADDVELLSEVEEGSILDYSQDEVPSCSTTPRPRPSTPVKNLPDVRNQPHLYGQSGKPGTGKSAKLGKQNTHTDTSDSELSEREDDSKEDRVQGT